jgi:HTH-type transcriptional regulator/antitoxin MqsA
MKCSICINTKLIHDTRDIQHTYKGEIIVIQNVTGDFCHTCGESILEADEARRVGSLMGEFRKQVSN